MANSVQTDGLYNDFYPAYVGAGNFAPIMADVAPFQPVGGSDINGPGLTLPQGHHMPLIAWAGIFIIGAVVLMHLADRA